MADGPSSPEQPNLIPSRSKFGGLGRLFRRGTQIQVQPAVDVEKPVQPGNKFTTIMAKLDRRNQELGRNFLSDFGERDSRFLAIRHSLLVEEDKYPSKNIKHNRRVNDDFLIVTAEGFKILRVRNADLKHDPQFPQYEVVHKRDGASSIAGNLARGLIWRGNPNNRWADPEKKAGSGYSHSGRKYDLNFGQGHTLTFHTNSETDEVAFLDRPTPVIEEFAEKQNTVTALRGRAKMLLSDIETHGMISLVVHPDQEEVVEIMRYSLKEAKDAQDRERQRLQEEEEKRLSQTAKPVTPEPKPDVSAEIAATQDQIADEVLGILEES